MINDDDDGGGHETTSSSSSSFHPEAAGRREGMNEQTESRWPSQGVQVNESNSLSFTFTLTGSESLTFIIWAASSSHLWVNPAEVTSGQFRTSISSSRRMFEMFLLHLIYFNMQSSLCLRKWLCHNFSLRIKSIQTEKINKGNQINVTKNEVNCNKYIL